MLYPNLLRCPICMFPLAQTGNSLKCSNAHSFDISSDGYVNLLGKKLPGDAKEMLVARRAFLEAGHYRPLSALINQLVCAHLPATITTPTILDAGCGEGYYLGALQEHLLAQDRQAQYVGLDISKDAIRLAAKRYKHLCFVVANVKERLVFGDAALHVVLNVFAPRNPLEFARILGPGGLLLLIIPTPEHLQELRSALHLLNIEEQKEQKVTAQFSSCFELVTSSPLSYKLQFSHKEIEQVVMMTPNYWHLAPELHVLMEKLDTIETTVSFTGLVFRCR